MLFLRKTEKMVEKTDFKPYFRQTYEANHKSSEDKKQK